MSKWASSPVRSLTLLETAAVGISFSPICVEWKFAAIISCGRRIRQRFCCCCHRFSFLVESRHNFLYQKIEIATFIYIFFSVLHLLQCAGGKLTVHFRIQWQSLLVQLDFGACKCVYIVRVRSWYYDTTKNIYDIFIFIRLYMCTRVLLKCRRKCLKQISQIANHRRRLTIWILNWLEMV